MVTELFFYYPIKSYEVEPANIASSTQNSFFLQIIKKVSFMNDFVHIQKF